ncbi:hypothetical protein EDB89DRAFT_2183783 [Lactarius sanguifluus]|nr:hypothetical protein EDB89DRAFT_2183783 [Lactarius sanguifluus]
MPALIPVHNTLGALFIGTVLSSMLVDSANVVFVIHTNYHIGITNFGDYKSLPLVSWSLPLFLKFLSSRRSFYAYRIYLLSRRSPYLPIAISAVSLTAFVFGAKILKHLHELGNPFQARLLLNLCIATLFCDVVCDVLITFGMVYNLLSNRTRVRRTNEVLNLLAIYAVNCGTLTLVFAISCGISLVKYPDALIYTPSFFIMIRLYFCAFMSILNSRDNLRETLDRQEGIVVTLSKIHTGTTIPCDVQDTIEVTTNKDVSESPPPVSVSFDTFSDGVMTLDREKYPVYSVPGS